MEQVAGRAETLAKQKAKDTSTGMEKPQSIYSKVYASDGKQNRNKRAEQRELRQQALNRLGDIEYKKLLQEVDWMTHTSVDIHKLIDKRIKEMEERMEEERKKQEKADMENASRRVTRSTAGTSTEVTEEVQPTPASGKSPKKHTKEQETGGKKPKTSQEPKSAHIDDENYELPKDLETGRPIKKRKRDNRKDEEEVDTLDASKTRGTRGTKKSSAIPLPHDDDDDDDDLMVLDDEDHDKNYEPEDDQRDEDEYPPVDDDDDDFDIPPLRPRKSEKKERKQTRTKKKSTQRGVEIQVSRACTSGRYTAVISPHTYHAAQRSKS